MPVHMLHHSCNAFRIGYQLEHLRVYQLLYWEAPTRVISDNGKTFTSTSNIIAEIFGDATIKYFEVA